MKKQHNLFAFLLIGIGTYFLLKQLRLPIFTDFYSWPTLFIIIGLSFLLHSYISKDYKNLFPGTIIFGLGIHFHGLNHYSFWIDHWGVYPFIISIGFLIRFQKTKNGLIPGLILFIISLFAIFVTDKPEWFGWVNKIVDLLENFWPFVLIIAGAYLLFKKK
ncbi:LiaI-LiaF-like domain-containing protein [Aquibacillus rhizosphaerae]|uniref:DUF5668 domain-containing protein n=1 Tax=Aquibacillus rhizosphaerae TaxID=3051431 RepID=A0ABT7L782_9BACI|nr:DUF5668 domain-containing protein [Aquibacillus sp. LR5S19]MDL4841696.1 DUF5668 domain-containing protein [Aquibacillus sp. LR5S19]